MSMQETTSLAMRALHDLLVKNDPTEMKHFFDVALYHSSFKVTYISPNTWMVGDEFYSGSDLHSMEFCNIVTTEQVAKVFVDITQYWPKAISFTYDSQENTVFPKRSLIVKFHYIARSLENPSKTHEVIYLAKDFRE